MSPEKARKIILQKGEGGKIFYVRFVKRTTGEIREMTCRLHVQKGVKGVVPPEARKREDLQNDVMTVYEMGVDSGFKRIPLDAVIEVR